ncbi:MAG TPA: GNAT family N-acetyltransferase [Candidatus Acidoferrum sp.]|nr:GNAT family N-acetyltransferase [Candidatus Acidoferrum sp.]
MTATPIRILLDTNVLIAAESDEAPRHPQGAAAAELLSLAARLGHTVCLAASVRDDLARHANEAHRQRRNWQLQRYHVLESIAVPAGFREKAGYPPTVGPNGLVDMTLLLALERSAVQWLVTEDQPLHGHARQLDLADRTFTIADALDVLRRQIEAPLLIPAVQEIKGFQLDVDDPIFDDFDAAYKVREWVRTKVAPQHRPCLVIGEPGQLDSLVILNQEEEQPWSLPQPALKICTFKVAEAARGVKRGELLLWAIFQYARRNSYESIFVEVFAHELALIAMLESFGFTDLCVATSRQAERVYGKRLHLSTEELDPLAHNIAYGPGALRPERLFLVPIVPHWHASLFPVADEQLSLMPGLTDHGNAIRKAYLCHSPSRQLQPGDVLLFFRTHRDQQVRAVGIVEQTLVSADPARILEFTGRRTVYTPTEVDGMCRGGKVLAIRFRLDRVLDTPLSMDELIHRAVMRRSPQSIMRVQDPGATQWLQDLLAG